MSDLFTGNYAAYVWSAYAVFFVVLAFDALAPVLHRRRLVNELRARLTREAARQRSRGGSP
jgi:heme exporter protein D